MIHIQVATETEALTKKYANAMSETYLSDKLIEEMAELTQALIKYRLKRDSEKFRNIEEEFEDVLVHMLLLQDKFMLVPNCSKRVEKLKSHLEGKNDSSRKYRATAA